MGPGAYVGTLGTGYPRYTVSYESDDQVNTKPWLREDCYERPRVSPMGVGGLLGNHVVMHRVATA